MQCFSSGGAAISAASTATASARLSGDITQLNLQPLSGHLQAPILGSAGHIKGDFVVDVAGEPGSVWATAPLAPGGS